MNTFLSLNIVQGAVIDSFAAASVVLGLFLLARRPSRRWVLTALIALASGALIGVITIFVTVSVLNLFGTRFTLTVNTIIVGTFAAVALALASLWRTRWWRRALAIVAVLVFVVTGTLGVNAAYGLNKTVAAFFGITNEKPLAMPVDPQTTMPATGSLGTVDIPHAASGFIARTALAYLPPAALVANAPALPVIIQLNGQPGSPGLDDPKVILDKLAAADNGLAPIVINPDQLGDDSRDPLCLDTARGNVETYIMNDVVPWVRSHFNVRQDPKDWTVLGFSNGGMCAAYFGAKYPGTFGNVVDISGDEYQGVDDASTLSKVFHGDEAAYRAVWPTTIMSQSTYSDSYATFAVGQNDDEAIPGVKKNYDAAVAAGIHSTYTEIAGSGHDNTALDGGLSAGYAMIYARSGLGGAGG